MILIPYIKKKKDLRERVKKEDSLNTVEINQYLAKNKTAKKVFKANNFYAKINV